MPFFSETADRIILVLLIILGVVFVMANWGIDWLQEMADRSRYRRYMADCQPNPERIRRHRIAQRQKDWESAIRRQMRKDKVDAADDVMKEITYSLAIHQEIIEELYGRETPTAAEIIRKVNKKS